jgi:hypothetical protein
LESAEQPSNEKQLLWAGGRIVSPKPRAVEVQESLDLARKLTTGDLGFRQVAVVQRWTIRPTHIYTYHQEGGAPGGGLYLLTVGQNGGLKRLVDAGDGQIQRLDVSFDGKEILFNWRRGKNERYQVWRIGTDGTGLTQLTDGPHDNYDACWLPDGDIAFLSTRCKSRAYCWASDAGVLHRMDRDGGQVRRISHNLLHDFTPAVMDDGKLLYMRWEYVDRGAIPTQSLWTLNPDGTNLQAYFGNRIERKKHWSMPSAYFHARQIPGTAKVLCVLATHTEMFGKLGILDPMYGNNAPESLRILDVVKSSTDKEAGQYCDSPHPLDERYCLFSTLGTLLVASYDGAEASVLLKPDAWLGFFDAQPIRPRQVPVRASTLPSGDPEPWATVFIQDVYQGLEPQVKRGEITQVCVVEEMAKPGAGLARRGGWDFQSPATSCGATYAPKKVWGFAPVQEDGSACFLAPANVPLSFMVMDARGRAIQRMRSFTHFMPGAIEGCIGCHESRSTAPVLGRSHPRALRRIADKLREPAWGVTGFSYPEVVQPVLDKHCIRCHGAEKPAKGVRLTAETIELPGPRPTPRFNTSYVTLTRRRPLMGPDNKPSQESRYWNYREYHDPRGDTGPVVANLIKWVATDNGTESNIAEITPKFWCSPASPLADLILSGHRDQEGKPRIDLDDESCRKLLLWMDLNVPYYGSLTENR